MYNKAEEVNSNCNYARESVESVNEEVYEMLELFHSDKGDE